MAMDEVTGVMKLISDEVLSFEDAPKDFTPDDLCFIKQMLMDLEKQIDDIKIGQDGQTFEGTFIFDLFEKIGVRRRRKMAKTDISCIVICFLNNIFS